MNEFDDWNLQKQNLDAKKVIVNYKKREIYWTRLGKNIGYEQEGKGENFLRPVIIFKKFNKRVFWGIPLSKTEKEGVFYFKFNFKEEKSTALLSQLRLFDIKRAESKMGMMTISDFQNLEKAIHEIMNDF